jgi:hypothetical protein
MDYLLFWIKVAARRFGSLFKTSPVIIIGAVVIIAAFIVARNDIAITLDTRKVIFAVSFFILVSLLLSFKKYSTAPFLIMYSKSGLQNKYIYVLFFLKRAFFNNILLFFFNIAALKGIVMVENFIVIPAATVCSLVLSLLLMYVKNEYISRKVRKISVKRQKSRVIIKSAVCDYFTSDFLLTAMISIVLFVIITVEFIKNKFSLSELENPSILLIGMVVILSVGFMGIIDSISRINWKFLSIISPKNYNYHFNRTILFLACVFSLLIALFIFVTASSGIVSLLKYLYCMLVLLLFSINISFMIGGIIYKMFIFVSAVALTVWISALHIAFLPILAVPVIITFLKAKNEYREWYYL